MACSAVEDEKVGLIVLPTLYCIKPLLVRRAIAAVLRGIIVLVVPGRFSIWQCRTNRGRVRVTVPRSVIVPILCILGALVGTVIPVFS